MRARAHVRTELASDGRGHRRTRVAVLRSQAPLKLRPANGRGSEPLAAHLDDLVRLCLTAAAAGPVGGDDLELDVEVAAGSTLVLIEASATLLLPGSTGARSRTRVRVRIDPGGTFVWWPEPVIAAARCHHLTEVDIDLAADARLVLREELLLGRHGEEPGAVRQCIRVRRDGRPLHRQDLTVGAGQENGPAVLGAHRAVGSLVVVDPALTPAEVRPLDGDGVLMPLAGGNAAFAQALAADSIALRRQLDTALGLLGPPWDPPRSIRHPTPADPPGGTMNHHHPRRALRLGVAGPVGTGKSSIIATVCRNLADELSIAVITNDIYTDEDARFLRSVGVLPEERIRAVETGACPHTAIRDDITMNLMAVEDIERDFAPLDLVLVESGGDNLTATFSPGLVDAQIFVLDVAGGGDVARKGGPGIARADLLVVNKVDLAPYVEVDVDRMVADATRAREHRPVLAVSRTQQATVDRLCDWIRGLVADHAAGRHQPSDPGPMAPHTHRR